MTFSIDKVYVYAMFGEALSGGGEFANRCPVCRSKIVVPDGGQVLIKNAILRVDRPSGRVTAKCAQCKSWVEVPLTYVG